MSIANKALAILAAFAFFLPFVSLTTSVPYLNVNLSISVSGQKLVQCYLSPCSPKDILGSQPGFLGTLIRNIPDSEVAGTVKFGGREGQDLGLNFVLFAAIAVVVAAIAVFLGRGGELLSGLASVGVIVLLFMFRSKIGDAIGPLLNSPEIKAAGGMAQVQFQYGIGFWACAVLSGLSAILAFKGTGGTQGAVAAAAPMRGYVPPPQPGAIPSSGEKLAVCSACGSVNTAGSKFCLSCGAAMAAPAPPRAVVAEPQGPVCPACGSNKAGAGKFCLACGASMAAAAASAPEPAAAAPQGPVCPSCGSDKAGAGKFCLACGASMAAPAAAAPAPEPAAPVPQGPVCPSCGSDKAGTGKFCLACGASMAAPAAPAPEPAAAAPQSSVCPSCGSDKAGTGKFCLACGGSLMAGVQLFQPSETHASAPPIAVAAAAAPAAMAAQASAAAPVGQSFRATAPPPVASEPPIETPVATPPAPPVVEEPATPVSQAVPPSAPPQVPEQSSLDWAAPAPPQPKPQACAACGAAINAEQKFCLACGTPVAQPSAPVTSEPPAFTPAPQEQFQPPVATQIFEPAPKSSSKVWIVVVLALAALGTGGWFAWQYFTRPDVTVTAIRPKIHVAAGGRADIDVSVSGSGDIDWSIQEGQKGGQVNAQGAVMVSGQPLSRANYVAPQTTGVYHVIATSHANPGRSAQVEITVVGAGSAEIPAATTSAPAPPSGATATTSTTPGATPTPSAAFPNAAQIVGAWSGPTSDMRTVIGADSTISMTSAANPQKNLNGTYHFTDNTHLDVDFGNGDVRKWEILGVDNSYLRVNSQSKDGSSAIIFARTQ